MVKIGHSSEWSCKFYWKEILKMISVIIDLESMLIFTIKFYKYFTEMIPLIIWVTVILILKVTLNRFWRLEFR